MYMLLSFLIHYYIILFYLQSIYNIIFTYHIYLFFKAISDMFHGGGRNCLISKYKIRMFGNNSTNAASARKERKKEEERKLTSTTTRDLVTKQKNCDNIWREEEEEEGGKKRQA